MRKLIFISALFVTGMVSAQLPGFEIYLMDMPAGGNPISPVNITNHPGYDNQPSFSPDGKYILFSSFRDTIQSDIYKYDLKKKLVTQVTHTIESEYSPEVTPDKKHISVVRVETDSSQRFCEYDLKGENHKLLLDSVKLIGYYGRYDEQWLVMFNLPEPFSLDIANLLTGYTIHADQSIGRCIKKIPGSEKFSYISKTNDSVWVIEEVNFYQTIYQTGNVVEITKIPAESEDYAWSPDGSKLFMARGAALFYFDYAGDKQWHPSADLSQSGIKKIYRLAISPNGKQMAFVSGE